MRIKRREPQVIITEISSIDLNNTDEKLFWYSFPSLFLKKDNTRRIAITLMNKRNKNTHGKAEYVSLRIKALKSDIIAITKRRIT